MLCKMPQTRAERLAQRAAERRAKVDQQTTHVADSGATAAAREQQRDSYMDELAQNKADRGAHERAEADRRVQADAEFQQKFAPPPGLVAAAPSLRQQAVASAMANRPDPFAAKRAATAKARAEFNERRRQLQQRIPTPPPPSPGPPPGPPPGGLEAAFPPRGGGLEDAFPPRGGGPPRGREPEPNPFEKPVDPLRDPPGRRAGIDPLPTYQPNVAAGRAAPLDPARDAPPPPRRDDPLRDTWGQAPVQDGREQRAQYAAQLRQQMAEQARQQDARTPPTQPARQPGMGQQRGFDKAAYAAELRQQMAADGKRRDAREVERHASPVRHPDASGIIGGANLGRNARNNQQAAYAEALARDQALKGEIRRDDNHDGGIIGGSNLSNDDRHDRQTAYAVELRAQMAADGKRRDALEFERRDASPQRAAPLDRSGIIGGANLSSNARHDRQAVYAAELARDQALKSELRRDDDGAGGSIIGGANLSNGARHDRQAAYAEALARDRAVKSEMGAHRTDPSPVRRREAPIDGTGIIGGVNLGRNARNTQQAAYAEALARDQAVKSEIRRDEVDDGGIIGGSNLSNGARHDRQASYAEALDRDRQLKSDMGHGSPARWAPDAASRDVGGTGTRADAGGIIGGQNEGRNARNTRQAAYADALARDRALKSGPGGRGRPDQRQRAKSGTPPGWYVGPTGQLCRMDPRDNAGRTNAALAVGVPHNYTPAKTVTSPALDRTPHVRHDAASGQGFIGEPERDQGQKAAMADMWKRQLEADVAEKKRVLAMEEEKEREEELKEERRLQRERAEMEAKHAGEAAADEKLRQREAQAKADAARLEQRKIQRDRDEAERKKKDAEDDARVAREQRELQLKYENDRRRTPPPAKMGMASAAKVVSSISRLRPALGSPPPPREPSPPPSPSVDFGTAGLVATSAAKMHATPAPSPTMTFGAAGAAARAHATPAAPRMSFESPGRDTPAMTFGSAGLVAAAAARAHHETPTPPAMSFGDARLVSEMAARAHHGTPAAPQMTFGSAGLVAAAAARTQPTPAPPNMSSGAPGMASATHRPEPVALNLSAAPPLRAPSPAPVRRRKRAPKLPDKQTDSLRGWLIPGRDQAACEGPPATRLLPEAASRLERALQASRAATPSTARLDGASQLVFPDGRVVDGQKEAPSPARATTPCAPASTPVKTQKPDDVDALLRRNRRCLVRAEALADAADAARDLTGAARGEALDRLLGIAGDARPQTPRQRVEASLPSDVRWATVAPSPRLESVAKDAWQSARKAARGVAAFAR